MYQNRAKKKKKGQILALGEKAESPQQAEYAQEELLWASPLLIKSLTQTKHPLSAFSSWECDSKQRMYPQLPSGWWLGSLTTLWVKNFFLTNVSLQSFFFFPTQPGRSTVEDIRLTWEDLSLCLIDWVWTKSGPTDLLLRCCSWSLLHISSQCPSLGVQ